MTIDLDCKLLFTSALRGENCVHSIKRFHRVYRENVSEFSRALAENNPMTLIVEPFSESKFLLVELALRFVSDLAGDLLAREHYLVTLMRHEGEMETGVACLLAHVASIIAANDFNMSAVTPANISSFADRTFSFLARASGHGLHRYLQSILKSFAAPSIVDIAIKEATCDAGFGQLLRAAAADLPAPRSVEVRCAWCRPVLVCGLYPVPIPPVGARHARLTTARPMRRS